MDVLGIAFSLLQLINQWTTGHLFAVVAIGIVAIALLALRRWPDLATITFLRAGIRGGKLVDEYRQDIAVRTAEREKRLRQANDDNQFRIRAIRLEQERIEHLVRINPRLVKEVGRALQAVEEEYLNSLKNIQSDHAREVLRLATEKRVNDMLTSLGIPADPTQVFHIESDRGASNH